MRRIAIMSLAAALGVVSARADEAEPSWYAEVCRMAIENAMSSGAWRWQRNAHVTADDAVFQRELRKALDARSPKGWQPAEGAAQQGAARRDFTTAVRETETMRRISEASEAAGYTRRLQMDFGEVTLSQDADGTPSFDAGIRTSGRSTNVTAVLRSSLKQLRMLGRRADLMTGNVPPSWYEAGEKDGAVFQSRCLDVNGQFRFTCSYQMRGEAECFWKVRTRRLGKPLVLVDIEDDPLWSLLAKRPCEYAFEDVLKVFGRPFQSSMLSCGKCGRQDMNWTYEIRDTDYHGGEIHHTLVFAFAADGTCSGWKWCAVPDLRSPAKILTGSR